MLRLALIQLGVSTNKPLNVQRAVEFIAAAKEKGAHLAVLPECFNSPYGVKFFSQYCEPVPGGETCEKLSEAARKNSIAVVGGSVPEIDEATGKLYNTCPVFKSDGSWVGKYRKIHLFDVNIPGKISFKESDACAPGSEFLSFTLNSDWKVGVGICFDVRFPELANIYTEQNCNLLLYPGAFNMTTGPVYWEIIQKSRAIDNQLFVATCSPARNEKAGYVAWGHSMAHDPWGKQLGELDEKEDMLIVDLDPSEVGSVREAIPTRKLRRPDLYYKENKPEKSDYISR